MANAYPSAGGIAMFLQKAYGPGVMTGACALLMALSMVINERLVARTFGTYTLQVFDIEHAARWEPVLGVGLILFAFLVNLSGNRAVGAFSLFMAALKIGGIALFGLAGLAASGFSFTAEAVTSDATTASPVASSRP
jgi:amino acid transporter